MLDPYALHLLGRDEGIPKDTLARIAKEVGRAHSRSTQFWMLFVLWMIFALGLILPFAMMVREGQTPDLRHFLPGSLGGLLLPWVLWEGEKRRCYRRALEVMLRHSRCPHCGYDLRLLPTDPADGATVCPECGCAWRLPGSPPPT